MEKGVYLIPIATDGEKEVVTGARVNLEDLLNAISEAAVDHIHSAVLLSMTKEQEENK